MSADKKLWIDMTDLSRWKGNMTGVQRVVYEIAARYNASEDNVGYFVYDDKLRQFYEIPFSIITESIAQPDALHDKRSLSIAKKVAQVTLGAPIKLYKSLPDDVKERIPEPLLFGGKLSIRASEKIARTLLHYMREMRSQRVSKEVREASSLESAKLFKEGDTVFVIGASWDSKTKIFDIAVLRDMNGFSYVQVIHDVIPSFNPYLFGDGFSADFSSRMFESIAAADLLLCVSKATASELKKLCETMRIQPPKIEVIRLGDDYEQSSSPVRPKKMHLDQDEKFILCVGTYEVRKNHMLLYYAVKEAIYRGVEIPKIIIIGRPGWLVGDLTYTLDNDRAVHDKIQYLGGVSDDEKTWLFQHCTFTIFPSVFEGWGLPVGESLYYGKPCLSSDVSSMPEIGGDLVDYFSPFNSGECLDKIISYLDTNTLMRQQKRISETYKPRLWDDTFHQVHRYIEKI